MVLEKHKDTTDRHSVLNMEDGPSGQMWRDQPVLRLIQDVHKLDDMRDGLELETLMGCEKQGFERSIRSLPVKY